MSRAHPHVPIGCDQQGRYPEAGHACSEFLSEKDLDKYQASGKYVAATMFALLCVFLAWLVYLISFLI